MSLCSQRESGETWSKERLRFAYASLASFAESFLPLSHTSSARSRSPSLENNTDSPPGTIEYVFLLSRFTPSVFLLVPTPTQLTL
jgi:hypothetical protein